MTTSHTIVGSVLLYYAVMFILFSNLPTGTNLDSYTLDSSSIDEDSTPIFDTNTTAENSPSSVSTIDTLQSVLTFRVQGLSWEIRLLASSLPLIMLAVGIYGLIRGF